MVKSVNMSEQKIMKERIIQSLDDIRPGDKVLCHYTHSSRILQVDRITPTLIICGYNKFKKKTGQKVPYERWGICYIEVLTDELKQNFRRNVEKQELVKRLNSINWSEMSLETLAQISSIINVSMNEK